MKEKFKGWKVDNKLTGRKQASDLLGIPIGTYKNWETGRSTPTKANLDSALGHLEAKDPRLWEDLRKRLAYEKAPAATDSETGKQLEHSHASDSRQKASQPAGPVSGRFTAGQAAELIASNEALMRALLSGEKQEFPRRFGPESVTPVAEAADNYLEESLRELSTQAKNRDYDSLEDDFLSRGRYLVQVHLGNLLLEGVGQERARNAVREQLSRQLGILEQTGFSKRPRESWVRGPRVADWAEFLESLLDKELVDANFRKAIDQAIGIEHTLWAVVDFMLEVRQLEELVSLLETPMSGFNRHVQFRREVSADELLAALSEPLRLAYEKSDLGRRHFSDYGREFVEPVQSLREPVEKLCKDALVDRAHRHWENAMDFWWKDLQANLERNTRLSTGKGG